MQRILSVALGAAVVLGGCGTATSSTSQPSFSAASGVPSGPVVSAPPTAAPATTKPSTAPRPPGTLAWPATFAVEMTPGTYFTSPPFVIPMTVPMSEAGWYAGHLNATFIDLQRYDGVEVGGFPTRMLGFGWPETVRGGSGAVPVAGLTPQAAIDLMSERGSVQASEATPVELFGLEGARFDLHSDLGNNPIFGSADGDFGLGPELDMRLVVLPLDDGLLMVAILATSDDLDDALDQARSILDEVELLR